MSTNGARGGAARGRGSPFALVNTARGGTQQKGRGALSGRGTLRGTAKTQSSAPAPRTIHNATGNDSDPSVRLRNAKTARDQERVRAIQQGFLADPNRPRTLAEAITPVGTCPDMCAEYERVERIVQNDVWQVEQNEDGSPDESRMVKKFRRAAAGIDEQLPSDLRPPAVLRSTIDYLFTDVVGNASSLASVHHFVWDRTRAIRNDFSIQQITKPSDVELAVECYERIARFHIVSLHQFAGPEKPYERYDWYQEREQLDRTLLSLGQYYDDTKGKPACRNEAEFRAYAIIFQIQSPTPDMEERLNSWSYEVKTNPRVQVALELSSAASSIMYPQGPLKPFTHYPVARQDWNAFFVTIESRRVSYLMACVTEIYFNVVRKILLTSIWRAFRRQGSTTGLSEVTISRLTEILRFDEPRQTRAFCDSHGLGFKISDEASREESLDLNLVQGRTLPEAKPALSPQTFSKLVESKRFGRSLSAVINGLSYGQAKSQGLLVGNDDDMQSVASDFSKKNSHSLYGSSNSGMTSSQPKSSHASSLLAPTSPFTAPPNSSSPFAPQASTALTNPFTALPSQNATPNGLSPFAPKQTFSFQTSSFVQGQNSQQSSSLFAGTTPNNFLQTNEDKNVSVTSDSGLGNGVFASSKPSTSPFSFTKPSTPSWTPPQLPATIETKSPPLFSWSQPSTAPPQPITQPAIPTQPTASDSKSSNAQTVASKFSTPVLAASSSDPLGSQSPFGSATNQTKIPASNTRTSTSENYNPSGFAKPQVNFSLTPTTSSAGSQGQQSAKNESTAPETNPRTTAISAVSSIFNFASSSDHSSSSGVDVVPSKTDDSSSHARAPPLSTTVDPPLFATSSAGSSNENTATSKPIFLTPNQPKKPSPLSKSFTAPIETTNSGQDASVRGPATARAVALPPYQPSKVKIDPQKVLTRLAKEILLDPERGLLQQFVEYHARSLIVSVYDDLLDETQKNKADAFRRDTLAVRYGKRWRHVSWRLKLLRQGRAKREKRREALRNKEAKVSQHHRSKGIDAVDNFLASHSAGHDINYSMLGSSLISRDSMSSARRSRLSSRVNGSETKREIAREDRHDVVGPTSSADRVQSGRVNKTHSSLTPPTNAHFLGFSVHGSRHGQSSPKPSASRSTYFRMKAMGLLTNGTPSAAYNVRKRVREDDDPDAVKISPAHKRSRTPPRSIAQSERSHSPKSQSSLFALSSPGVGSAASSRPLSRAEEDDDALLARARAARQALAESAHWYRNEVQVADDAASAHSASTTGQRRNVSGVSGTTAVSTRALLPNGLATSSVPAYRLRESRFVPREDYRKALDKARQTIQLRSLSGSRTSGTQTPGKCAAEASPVQSSAGLGISGDLRHEQDQESPDPIAELEQGQLGTATGGSPARRLDAGPSDVTEQRPVRSSNVTLTDAAPVEVRFSFGAPSHRSDSLSEPNGRVLTVDQMQSHAIKGNEHEAVHDADDKASDTTIIAQKLTGCEQNLFTLRTEPTLSDHSHEQRRPVPFPTRQVTALDGATNAVPQQILNIEQLATEARAEEAAFVHEQQSSHGLLPTSFDAQGMILRDKLEPSHYTILQLDPALTDQNGGNHASYSAADDTTRLVTGNPFALLASTSPQSSPERDVDIASYDQAKPMGDSASEDSEVSEDEDDGHGLDESFVNNAELQDSASDDMDSRDRVEEYNEEQEGYEDEDESELDDTDDDDDDDDDDDANDEEFDSDDGSYLRGPQQHGMDARQLQESGLVKSGTGTADDALELSD